MKYRFPDNVVFQEVGEELVLLDLQSGTYFGLNETGAEIYRLLLDRGNLEQLPESFAHYDVDSDELTLDARQLIEELLRNGLLEEQHT